MIVPTDAEWGNLPGGGQSNMALDRILACREPSVLHACGLLALPFDLKPLWLFEYADCRAELANEENGDSVFG